MSGPANAAENSTTLPFAFAFDEPDAWHAVPEAERKQRGVLTRDQCVIDDKEFYIRGRMEIPMVGDNDSFIWDSFVWAFGFLFPDRLEELWDIKIREHEPPISGLLGSDMSIYPQTLNLKCSLHFRNEGKRPSIVLEPSDHPLAVEQRSGISLDCVKEIASRILRHG